MKSLATKLIVYVIITTITFQCTLSQRTTGKLFLLGGATSDSSSNIYNALRQATDKLFPKIAVVISGAPSLAEGLNAYYVSEPNSKSYEQLFTDYGFEPSLLFLAIDNYRFANSNTTSLGIENIEKIKNADIVFFNGGDQSRHSRSWLNEDGTDSQIMTALRQKFVDGTLVIAGTSAGTAVQGQETFGSGRSYGYYYFNADLKPCNIGDELVDDRQGNNSYRYDENGAYLKGFGFLTGALMDTHFDARGRFARLIIAMKQIGKEYGFGVDEDTGFYINGEEATVYGTWGVWVIDSSEANFPATTYFSVQSVRVTYLTDGDSYNLVTKVITSRKPIITSPQGNIYDSDRIFDTDEGLRSIKSLVSSSSANSIGYSFESGPTCRVVFEKDQRTIGHVSNQQYTIENLKLSIGTR